MSTRFVLGLVSTFALASGCTVAVTEAQMQDQAQVTAIAKKEVKTAQNNGAHIKRVAFIGLETPNQVHDSNSDFHGGGVVGHITGIVGAVQSAKDKAALLACRALEASYDDAAKAVAAAGFELVPFEEKLQMPQFQGFVNAPLPDWCYATRAPARINIVNPFKWKESMVPVQQLIDALGVDAILIGQLGADDNKTGESMLTLYVKNPNGYAVVGWAGRVKRGMFRFDVALPGKTEEAKLANATRVFTHAFQLLAAKMGLEAK